MNKKILKRLEIEILAYKKQICELEPYIASNASMAVAYNRMIIKKAILLDKFKKLNKTMPVIKKIGNILKFGKEKKLICDYFPPA